MGDPFLHLTHDNLVFLVRFERRPEGEYGSVDWRRHVVRIDPTTGPVSMLDTCVHEWLHMEFPKWKHKRVYRVARTIAGVLALIGVERTAGTGNETVVKSMLDAINAGFRVVRPKWSNELLDRYSVELASFLHCCGYRLMRTKRRTRTPKKRRMGFMKKEEKK